MLRSQVLSFHFDSISIMTSVPVSGQNFCPPLLTEKFKGISPTVTNNTGNNCPKMSGTYFIVCYSPGPPNEQKAEDQEKCIYQHRKVHVLSLIWLCKDYLLSRGIRMDSKLKELCAMLSGRCDIWFWGQHNSVCCIFSDGVKKFLVASFDLW